MIGMPEIINIIRSQLCRGTHYLALLCCSIFWQYRWYLSVTKIVYADQD